MSFGYKYIFFDLDHTLWDHDANSAETLAELYEKYSLRDLGIVSSNTLFQKFVQINNLLWPKYNAGEIDKFYLRNERFKLIFEATGLHKDSIDPQLVMDFNNDYLRECPTKPILIDGAFEVLKYLETKYALFIITNGFEEIQGIKMKSSGIAPFFDQVITSENAGFKKPNAGIFQYAMKHCKAEKEDSIMIGDNMQADILGAQDYGIDQVFFNPKKEIHSHAVTYEIAALKELVSIL